jgi:hypothetical protein
VETLAPLQIGKCKHFKMACEAKFLPDRFTLTKAKAINAPSTIGNHPFLLSLLQQVDILLHKQLTMFLLHLNAAHLTLEVLVLKSTITVVWHRWPVSPT